MLCDDLLKTNDKFRLVISFTRNFYDSFLQQNQLRNWKLNKLKIVTHSIENGSDQMQEFPEIHPLDATPEISSIYADIRLVSGVPMVNLIWRHFAALPGILPWAWKAVRPLVSSLEMIEARHRLIEAVQLPDISALSPSAREACGLHNNVMTSFTGMVDNYVRGNCTNIITLTALRLRLEGISSPSAIYNVAATSEPGALLPPLPKIENLPSALAEKVRGLAKRHDGSDGTIIPSLYLELARWPDLVDAFPIWLSQLYVPETLRAARESACRAAEREALAMLPDLDPTPHNVAQMRPALERFTKLIIPDLIPVCLATQKLIPVRIIK